MKTYVLYPGVGRNAPQLPLGYISGRQLAANYKIPYSDCLDTDIPAIKKVIEFVKKQNGPPMHLIPLLPNEIGIYKAPTIGAGKLMLVRGEHEMINKNG